MKNSNSLIVAAMLLASTFVVAEKPAKVYKHVSEFQMGVLDQNVRVSTGGDVTAAHTNTDAKLGPGGQNIHMISTEAGNYRVEAPVNKGRTFGLALATAMANSNRPVWAQQQSSTIHNQWFMDKVEPGTKVLFASECAAPNKKHPNDTVHCSFYFPDPDSTDHEYATAGDFTPSAKGDGSNTAKVGNVLCGTGKLTAEVETQLCGTSVPVEGGK